MRYGHPRAHIDKLGPTERLSGLGAVQGGTGVYMHISHGQHVVLYVNTIQAGTVHDTVSTPVLQARHGGTQVAGWLAGSACYCSIGIGLPEQVVGWSPTPRPAPGPAPTLSPYVWD